MNDSLRLHVEGIKEVKTKKIKESQQPKEKYVIQSLVQLTSIVPSLIETSIATTSYQVVST